MNARLASWMNRLAFAGFTLSVLLLFGALPIEAWMESVRAWIGGLGLWAPLAYAITYAVATTLFIPASALSLAAGLVFGLWLGSAVVWVGANLATVTSFVIARYFARSRVEAMAQSRPRFAAVDRALGEEGWKIVALMRLSPVFPFTLQNYLFGVTAIRFWPYAVSSAVFMIPGTFLYVYLGYAGGQAAAVATGAPGTDVLKLVLQAVGLIATILVTVIVARIAARAIAKHAPDESPETAPAHGKGEVSLGKSAMILGIACLCAVASLVAFLARESIRERFGPPKVQLNELFAGATSSEAFEISIPGLRLGEHVDSQGLVDYGVLAANREALGDTILTAGWTYFEQRGQVGKHGLLGGDCNALTSRVILDRGRAGSIRSISVSEARAVERGEIAVGVHRLALVRATFDRQTFRPDKLPGTDEDRHLRPEADETRTGRRSSQFDGSTGLAWLTPAVSRPAGRLDRVDGPVITEAARSARPLAQAVERSTVKGIPWLSHCGVLNDRAADAPSPILLSRSKTL